MFGGTLFGAMCWKTRPITMTYLPQIRNIAPQEQFAIDNAVIFISFKDQHCPNTRGDIYFLSLRARGDLQ